MSTDSQYCPPLFKHSCATDIDWMAIYKKRLFLPRLCSCFRELLTSTWNTR